MLKEASEPLHYDLGESARRACRAPYFRAGSVKQSNVQRSHVDELRGALYHHNAIQGTLLTTSDFSSGAKDAALLRGAPPISLIDGDRLVDLLIEHEIGIQKKPAVTYEIDTGYFDEVGE